MAQIFDKDTERKFHERVIEQCERYAARCVREAETAKSDATKQRFVTKAEDARRFAQEHRDRLRLIGGR